MALASSGYYLNQKNTLQFEQERLIEIRNFFSENNVTRTPIRTVLETNRMDGTKYEQLHQEVMEPVQTFALDANRIKWDIVMTIDAKIGSYSVELESIQKNYLAALFEEGEKARQA